MLLIVSLSLAGSVLTYKFASDKNVFDPNFGSKSIHGFNYVDPEKPFTAFFVKNGIDYLNASGNYSPSQQNLTLGGSEMSSVAYVFDVHTYASIVKKAGGEINESILLISTTFPQSTRENPVAWPESGLYVRLFLNNQSIAEERLTLLRAYGYALNVTRQYNIPGSGGAYQCFFARFPFSSALLGDGSNVTIAIQLEKGVRWDVTYVVLSLYSDYTSLTNPWYTQNHVVLSF